MKFLITLTLTGFMALASTTIAASLTQRSEAAAAKPEWHREDIDGLIIALGYDPADAHPDEHPEKNTATSRPKRQEYLEDGETEEDEFLASTYFLCLREVADAIGVEENGHGQETGRWRGWFLHGEGQARKASA